MRGLGKRWCGLYCCAVLALWGTQGKANDASEILASCEVFLRQMTMDGHAVTIPPRGIPCWYYISALQDAILNDDGQATLLKICTPPESRLVQHIRVFTQYAQNNPAALHNSPARIAVNAFRQAYPCGP